MQTHIARWGNSLALRIPRSLADRLGLGEGGAVELSVEPGRLVVRPGPRRLEALLAGITARNSPRASTTPHAARSAVDGRTRPGRSRLARLRAAGGARAGRAASGPGALPAGLSPAHPVRGRLPDHDPHQGLPIRGAAARRSVDRRCGARRSGQEHRPPCAPDRGRRPAPGDVVAAVRSGSGRCWKVNAMRDQAVDAPFTIFGHTAGAWSRCRGQPGAPSGSEGRTAAGVLSAAGARRADWWSRRHGSA